jgi:hypothetical protein
VGVWPGVLEPGDDDFRVGEGDRTAEWWLDGMRWAMMIPTIAPTTTPPTTAPANMSFSLGQIDFHQVIGGLSIRMTPAANSRKAPAAPSLAPSGI